MSAPARLILPVGPGDHLRGNPAGAVTLVEYGDFECPSCGVAYPIVRQLERDRGDRVRFVFRHFPLTSAHPHAQMAAEVAEWAASLGAFWQMHDAIYEQQQHLSLASLLRIAGELGLPGDALEAALSTHGFFARVKEDFLSGVKSQVTGTPAFFINDLRHDGPWGGDALAVALDRALSDPAAAPPDPAIPAPAARPPR